MTRSKLLISTSLCTALALPAFAESRSFGQVDTNGNRQLERTEIAAAFGARSADRMLSRQDRNGDGALSVNEVRSSRSDSESDDDEGDDDESDHNESDHNESDHNESDDDESDDDESDDDEGDDDESDDDEGDDDESDSDESDD